MTTARKMNLDEATDLFESLLSSGMEWAEAGWRAYNTSKIAIEKIAAEYDRRYFAQNPEG